MRRFVVELDSTPDGPNLAKPYRVVRSRAVVAADTALDASLAAEQMAAAQGRTPLGGTRVAPYIDWSTF